jgi:hypothetical protein
MDYRTTFQRAKQFLRPLSTIKLCFSVSVYIFLSYQNCIVYQGIPDFIPRNFLDGLIEYYIWYVKNEGEIVTFTKYVTIP